MTADWRSRALRSRVLEPSFGAEGCFAVQQRSEPFLEAQRPDVGQVLLLLQCRAHAGEAQLGEFFHGGVIQHERVLLG